MKISHYLRVCPSVLFVATVLWACGDKKSGDTDSKSQTPAAREHAAFRESLRDSAAYYADRADLLKAQVDTLNSRFETLNAQLEIDDREEYVEIYRVAKGWKGYDTMAGTGIIARLLENGTVEVVASSSAGPFLYVSLSAGSKSISTSPVPEGGGLNYTTGGISRVTFIGPDALALCRFADEHKGETLTLTYKGAKDYSVKLTGKQAEMLSLLGEVTVLKNELDQLNKDYMVAYNKQILYENEVNKNQSAR